MVAQVDRVIGILIHPSETFPQLRQESFGDAFQFYGILLILYTILSSFFLYSGSFLFFSLSPIMTTIHQFGILFIMVGTLISFLIGLFLGGAILHLFVYILGGRKGVEQTLKAVMYSTTPIFVFGWIPIIGFFSWIYALVLEILAIRDLQEISLGRSILAVLLPFVLILILVILALSLFLIVSSGRGFAQI